MTSEFEIKAVADVIKIADETEKHLEGLYNDKTNFLQGIWFRGQQDESWKLVPRVFRHNSSGRLYDEFNMFRHIQLIKPEYRKIYKTTFEWLCLLQHFGLPTRLLDWSEGILLALYFAVSDTEEKTKNKDARLFALSSFNLNGIVNQARKGSIYLPDDEEVIARAEIVNESDISRLLELIKYEYKFGEKIVRILKEHVNDQKKDKCDEELCKALSYPVAVYPCRLNNRMVVQQSVFTINGGSYAAEALNPIPKPSMLDDLNAKLAKKDKLLKSFVIPQKYKSKIKDELNRIGIHKGALFPELEYQASYINEKYMKKNHP